MIQPARTTSSELGSIPADENLKRDDTSTSHISLFDDHKKNMFRLKCISECTPESPLRRKDDNDPCSVYAQPMTLDRACVCPHFDAIFSTTSSSRSHLSSLGGNQQEGTSDILETIPYWKQNKEKSEEGSTALMEEYLATLRQVRMEYYSGSTSMSCQYCPPPSPPNKVNAFGENGDHLLQCLSCSFRGCGPVGTSFSHNNQHTMQHFVLSGHNFAVSCGPSSHLYCFACGDYIYHPLWHSLEIPRLDIQHQDPRSSPPEWDSIPVPQRCSFSSNQYCIIPVDNESNENSSAGNFSNFQKRRKIVWRGLQPTYLMPYHKQFFDASQRMLKRLQIFHYFSKNTNIKLRGNYDYYLMQWGPKATKLALALSKCASSTSIMAPVGMYNLGNTCFMSAVLQCLIHCQPFQNLFIHQVGHDFHSCHSKVEGGDEKLCLACEMDKLFLIYLASSIGFNKKYDDILEAIQEPNDLSSKLSPSQHNNLQGNFGNKNTISNKCSDKRGMPLIPSDLLTAVWNCPDTEHIAGYEQRDAHEFLQVLLDNLSKRFIATSLHNIRIKNPSIDASKAKPQDPIKHLFGGVLRSVLICETCGCKRYQPEPFLNISLSLSKELAAAEASKKNNDSAGTVSVAMGTRKSTNPRLSVELCLEHFTMPEKLTDPVHCPSCNEKTPTSTQHTFAKLPKILCLHLKRFDALTNKKITDFVTFPASGLDMGKFLPHWCEVLQGETNNTNSDVSGSMDQDTMKKETCPKIHYDLFGSIVHTGTLHQGHYMADIKVKDDWYHCNDAFVSKCKDGEDEVLKREGAYILFYKRR